MNKKRLSLAALAVFVVVLVAGIVFFGGKLSLTAAETSSCLDGDGPLLPLSGATEIYTNTLMADFTRVDASDLVVDGGRQSPVRFGGGDQVCWHGGRIIGGYPLDASWETTHSTGGIIAMDNTPNVIIENVYVESIGDGIRTRQGQSSGQAGVNNKFTVRGVWLKDIRDDCIESDWQNGAFISDSLLEGCYVMFATRKRKATDNIDGSNNVWEIRNVLGYLHDQIGVNEGPGPGHGMFFKWDDTGPKIEIHDSIFRLDSDNSTSKNEFNFYPEKMIDCSNNTLVWLGEGPFPAPLPSCFTLTTDKSVWDDAVAEWKARHGYSE